MEGEEPDQQFKTMESTVEVTSTTPTPPAPPGEWDSLPPEVQEIILKNLTAPSDLLTCRKVNSFWKAVTDSPLEEQCLSLWTSWVPFSVRRVGPPSPLLPVMKLILSPGENGQSLAWDQSTLPIGENPKLGSPFPSNSVKLITDTSNIPPSFLEGQPVEQMVMDISINYGHYLTSFVLSNFTTNFSGFNSILGGLENLKALTLNRVLVRPSDPDFRVVPLPPIPKLTHLKITFCISYVSQLLLDAYGNQLVSLETGTFTSPPGEKSFSNLKQLKVEADIKLNLQFPQLGPSPFPALQQLSVIYASISYKWEELLLALDSDSFPKTLVHLHLDVPVMDKEAKIMKESVATQNQHRNTFPLIKALGIIFPQNLNQAEIMKRWLLHKFPNLEVLHLMRYRHNYIDSWPQEIVWTWDDIDAEHFVDRVINAAGFWGGCPKLGQILVHLTGEDTVIHDVRRNT